MPLLRGRGFPAEGCQVCEFEGFEQAGLQSIAAYYNATPPGIVKVKGTLIGPSHADVEGSPNCASVALGCVLGVYGYLGYPTAWLRFQLQNDGYAHGAFVSGTGEIFSEAPNWQHVASNLP